MCSTVVVALRHLTFSGSRGAPLGYARLVRRAATIVLFFFGLTGSASAQSPACEWIGSPVLTALRVQASPSRLALVPFSRRRAAVSLVSIGVFSVRTVDDGAPILGATRERIAIVVSGVQTFSGVATVSSGAPIEDLTPRRGGLFGTIVIGDGARLERVALPCAQLGLASEVSSMARVGAVAAGPRWLSRLALLRVRARPEQEAPRALLRLDDRAAQLFVERERRDGWVRIEGQFARATLGGWVPDSDLTRVP